eukprot:gb/GEZN01017395.1/.p1 GENE.gb/GEZN01017395.1/~~gb/GEZN01017395.1/.p1  ORF type:complete len:252 (-),score=43.37 gb/GEZN01017395.1/:16-771(-)
MGIARSKLPIEGNAALLCSAVILAGGAMYYLAFAQEQTVEREVGYGTDMDEEEEVELEQASATDREEILQFHVANHLVESCHYPGELTHQKADVPTDFPELLDQKLFESSRFLTVREKALRQLRGVIGLTPDRTDASTIWLCAFSVAHTHRAQGIGTMLLLSALEEASSSSSYKRIRLITLRKHSKGAPIMAKARRLYERAGFKIYKEDKGKKFGHDTTINVVFYERTLPFGPNEAAKFVGEGKAFRKAIK